MTFFIIITFSSKSILENVILDSEGVPDFNDSTLTENTRGSYPIEFIENRLLIVFIFSKGD